MPKSFVASIFLILALAMTSFTPAGTEAFGPIAQFVLPPSDESGEMTDETPALWFVELFSPPTVEDGSLETIQTEKRNFRNAAKRANLQYRERFAFDTLWNGLSISMSASELNKLYRISGVKAIYPVITLQIPKIIPGEEPELINALAMTGADIVQNELGFTGAGVKVGVMDTGIDYHHPDLGGCFGPDCRVFTGYDFVGDSFNPDPTSPSYAPVPLPDLDPDDCNGHGTHVSGIVGANGNVKGVAPGVTFGAYRVFGCDGSTTADLMIAAMERALADNMDVLNISVGSAFQWPQYPTAQAADRLVNKGMVVVASIGNNGAYGLYSAGAPGLGKKVIGVAAFDNTHLTLPVFMVSPDDVQIGYTVAAASPSPPTSGTQPMARTGTTSSPDDACSPLPAGSLTGKAALIRRGTCTFYQKSLNAQNAGAIAVVLYNNAVGRFSPTVAGDPAITIPVVAISDQEGVLIDSRLAAGPVNMTWTDGVGSFPNPTGDLISSFSSFGLSPDLALKPDIGAPGGSIYSTYPLEKGGYASLSGTSMASAHVAGSVALLLQAHPHASSQSVGTILQNSADPHLWWGNPAYGFLDNVHRQGAGMLDIDDAILATTTINPGKISAGESAAGPFTQTLTIHNAGPAEVTYDVTHEPALATGGNTFTPSFYVAFASLSSSAPSVTVPAGSSVSVDVTITAPAAPERGQYGGYIVLTPQGGGQVYRVPYAGFIGDYQSIQALTPTPFLASLTACTLFVDNECVGGASYTPDPGGTTYSLVDGFNRPYFLVHLDHQVRLLRFEVFDANKGKAWHRALQLEYVGRNSTSTSFFAIPWDGTTTSGNKTYVVPDGQYVVKISALKALGDSNNTAHWETWTSPVITIDRP